METEKGYLYGVQQLIGVTRPSGTQSEWWFVARLGCTESPVGADWFATAAGAARHAKLLATCGKTVRTVRWRFSDVEVVDDLEG